MAETNLIFPAITPLGDSALLVQLGDAFSIETNKLALDLDRKLTRSLHEGVIETVPTIASVMVRFDPLVVAFETLKDWCLAVLETEPEISEGTSKLIVVPAIYGGKDGPDLGVVADLMGLREDQAIDCHSSAELLVMMLGFAPGCSYLGLLPPVWDIPRGTDINPQVPAGALLVALRQTVFPGTPMPTGWRQIGRAPVDLLDMERDPIFALSAGDRVRFEPVSANKAGSLDRKILWTAGR